LAEHAVTSEIEDGELGEEASQALPLHAEPEQRPEGATAGCAAAAAAAGQDSGKWVLCDPRAVCVVVTDIAGTLLALTWFNQPTLSTNLWNQHA
jgi:hypothetical protein